MGQGNRTQNFTPYGNTVALNAGVASSPTVLRSGGNYNLNTDMMVTNSGTNTVFITWGNVTTIAAVAPTAGNPANGIPVLAGETMVLGIGFATEIDAVTLANTSLVYFTPGQGS
jgi:hypothetical protein